MRTLSLYFSNFQIPHEIFIMDFNLKVGREDGLKQIIGNQSLHESGNDNSATVINISTTKFCLLDQKCLTY
jgi:hypothetical protein